MNGFLTEYCKLTKVADHTAAATTDVTSSSVDMQGWDGVVFFTSYGTAAADNLIHIEQSSDDGSSDTFTDVAGSEVNASGASDEDQFVDILRPEERYLRCIAVRGTSSTCESIWALQYRGRKAPFASSPNLTSGTIYGNRLQSPVAGTK
jgi:hypothetical protein